MNPVTVIKRSQQGEELWRYTGELIERQGNAIHLEAPYNGREVDFLGIRLMPGDLFQETYFTDRWYNIYEIHAQASGKLKGWYCNVGKPAVMEADNVLSYIDLALDLWVSPDGEQTVLDEDEFESLNLDAATRQRALEALKELEGLFHKK